MTRGPEHANKAQDWPSYMALDLEQDKPSMDLPFYVNGAPENPTGCSSNASMIGSEKTDQSFSEATPLTLRPQVNINIDPKESIPCKESTSRFPKGSNSYGDGVPIVGSGRRTQPLSKVGQRNYSTGPAAVSDGTVNLSKLIQLENGKFTGLYKTLATSEILIQAYHKIKSKPGNMTPGSDNETLDSFSLETVETIVHSLKNETFQFKPVRREYIPKKNGKTRPLGVPSPRDKIVQEAMKSLLEVIYEPIFYQELKITLSPEKTKISHFGENTIKFLGTYLSIPKVTPKKVVTRLTAKGKIPVRANQVRMNFRFPTLEILEKLANEGFLRDYKKGGKLIPNAITK
ncbi:hypothetical protein C0992_011178 [Termitomyces sp. T32_za158]|nr:hypothetical protein C0992_011178 [Termitomyces sp. T32_za158]